MTLLQSVNRVLRDLREDSIDSIDDSDHVQSIVDALNRGAERVLRYEDWSFLRRDDGQMFFPARFTATSGALVVAGSTTVALNAGSVNSWNTTKATSFSGSLRSRVRFPDDTAYANTSYIVTNFLTAANFNAQLGNAARSGAGVTTGAVEVYANEYVLASTVRSVLSMRHEEGPMRLQAIGDRYLEFDQILPRVTDSFQDDPMVAYVGGYGTGSALNGAGASSGLLVMVWPPPDADLLVHYSYTYQHASLSADTDAWTGVPNEHVSLIEDFAFAEELMGNRQAEADRGAFYERRALGRLDQLKLADRKQPNRRMVMQPYGSGGFTGGYRSRWATQTVPEPS